MEKAESVNLPEPEATPETSSQEESGQAEVTTSGELWTWVGLYTACMTITLILNSIVIVGLVKRKNRSPLDVYLTSLVISRMFIATFVIPARITGLFSEQYLGSILCKLCHYVGVASAATSIFSTTSIAVLKYKDIVGRSRHLFLESPGLGILAIWLTGYAYAVRTPFLYDLIFVDDADPLTGGGLWLCAICTPLVNLARNFIFVDFVCLFLLPGIVISVCYSKVIKRFQQQQQQQQPVKPQEKPPLDDDDIPVKTISTPEPRRDPLPPTVEQQRLVMSIVVWVAVLFFVCSSLPYAFRLYLFWSGASPLRYRTLETTLYLVSYSNAWMNAVVLLYYRPDIRRSAAAAASFSRDNRIRAKSAQSQRGVYGFG